ncbi:hypothetical protein [Longimicrobium sp.]|uniref:hypothetical protein n=1 Tax=Longimicrobium sp. TaxID=2029185 RepID=UPI003B3A7C11
MILPIRLLIVPFCLCAGVQAAAAQKMAYHGIAWHMPVAGVRTPVEALGFTFSSEVDQGDHEFNRADGARLRAEVREGRLVGFTLIDPARGNSVQERFNVLADSLQAELGAPDEMGAEGQPPARVWEAGLSSVRVEISRAAGERRVQVAWRGPGWYDEMDRRASRPPLPAGFTTVSLTPFVRIAVDTTVRVPRAAGAMRGRVRIEYFQPVTPSVEGVAQDPLDAVEYEMDFDCAGRRTRLISRTTFLDGSRQASNRPQNQPWTAVRQPDSHYARGLDAVCRAARAVR